MNEEALFVERSPISSISRIIANSDPNKFLLERSISLGGRDTLPCHYIFQRNRGTIRILKEANFHRLCSSPECSSSSMVVVVLCDNNHIKAV